MILVAIYIIHTIAWMGGQYGEILTSQRMEVFGLTAGRDKTES